MSNNNAPAVASDVANAGLPDDVAGWLRSVGVSSDNAEDGQARAAEAHHDTTPAGAVNVGDRRHVARVWRKNYQVYTPDLERLALADTLRGRPAFLICNGPSLSTHDLTPLQQRGVVTMGVNNGPAVLRPTYWTAVDGPERFIEQIWKDPTITKFVPLAQRGKKPRIRRPDGSLAPSAFPVEAQPNTHFFERNQFFNAASFLSEPTFNWGGWEDQPDAHGMTGARSVLLVALKLLFWLGAGRVYLLGADFNMAPNQANYAFPQGRTDAAIRGNNGMYQKVNHRLTLAQPFFLQAGFQVLNCTPRSGLTAFPYLPYDEAAATAAREVNERPINTQGMYD